MRLADIFESDMRDFFKQLQKTDPRFASLRVRGDAEHDVLRKQDQMAVQARRDQEATQGKALSTAAELFAVFDIHTFAVTVSDTIVLIHELIFYRSI